MDFEEAAPVLEAVGMAEARGEALDVVELARKLGRSIPDLNMTCRQLDSAALVLLAPADEPDQAPLLLAAGRQYLTMRGKVERDVLLFLPRVIDDLHARRSLISAGTVLVDEFRHALINGSGAEYASERVPPAFAEAVDGGLAVDLFAAAVALMTRLSCGEPAGGVAEEIMAVELLGGAEGWLETEKDEGTITTAEFEAAKGASSAVRALRGR